MATTNSARTHGNGGGPRGSYYAPAANIKMVDGLTKLAGSWWWTDRYVGTADAIEASGLLPRALLPGEPGMPTTSASYRPESSRRQSRNRHMEPGHVTVFRSLSGKFRIEIAVSIEEQQRRQDAREQRHREKASREAERERVLKGRYPGQFFVGSILHHGSSGGVWRYDKPWFEKLREAGSVERWSQFHRRVASSGDCVEQAEKDAIDLLCRICSELDTDELVQRLKHQLSWRAARGRTIE